MSILSRSAVVFFVAAALAACSGHGVTPQQPMNAPRSNQSAFASREMADDGVSPLAPDLSLFTPHVLNEYTLPGVGNVREIAKGSDGAIWFSDDAKNLVGKISLIGLVTKYTIPGTANVDFPNSMTLNIDQNLWIVHDYANISPAVLRMDSTGHFSEFSVGAAAGTYLKGITHDVSGDLWIAQGAQRIVRMDQLGRVIARYTTPSAQSKPWGMCYFSGLVWITERGANKVAAINGAGNFVGEFPIPTANSMPGHCVGLGNYVYFPETGAPTGKLGRININTHVVSEVNVPNVIDGLALDSTNKLWMAQGTVKKIARYDPATGIVTQYPIPTASTVVRIALGGDNNMWFPEDNIPTLKMAKLIPH